MVSTENWAKYSSILPIESYNWRVHGTLKKQKEKPQQEHSKGQEHKTQSNKLRPILVIDYMYSLFLNISPFS